MEKHKDDQQRIIYLLRHAQPEMAPGGKRYLGWSDPPLSTAGIDQARGWRSFFKTEDLAAAFCSDLKRARQTAEQIVDKALRINAHSELKEIHLGTWEGRTFEDVRREDPEGFARRGRDPAGFRPPSGESFDDLLRRVRPAFERILQNFSGNILIVAHAGVNRVLLCHLLGMPMENIFRIEQDYAALNIILERNHAVRIKALNFRPAFPYSRQFYGKNPVLNKTGI